MLGVVVHLGQSRRTPCAICAGCDTTPPRRAILRLIAEAPPSSQSGCVAQKKTTSPLWRSSQVFEGVAGVCFIGHATYSVEVAPTASRRSCLCHRHRLRHSAVAVPFVVSAVAKMSAMICGSVDQCHHVLYQCRAAARVSSPPPYWRACQCSMCWPGLRRPH